MSWLDGVKHRVRTLFQSHSYEHDIDEEMRFHIELDAMHQKDAYRARRRFGNRTYYKEETRRMTWLGSLDVFQQDASYAWRAIARTPGFTVLVVLTLALGIGLNAAMFTLLDRLYLRAPGGISDPSTLRRVWVEHFLPKSVPPYTMQAINYSMYQTIAEAAGNPEQVALFTPSHALPQGPTRSSPKLRGVFTSANYFPVLGARPSLGRFYTADEARLGNGAQVAVVSHHFWRTRLDADTTALGEPMQIGTNSYTVIGVAQPSFTGVDLQAADVWLPLASLPSRRWATDRWWESPTAYPVHAIVRLQPGADVRGFEQRATVAIRRLNRERLTALPDTQANLRTASIVEVRGPGKPRQELVISSRLGGVAIIVLLIACANVVNLLLARAMRRRREIAVRLALGISRWRLVRVLTTETVLLALIAAAAAVLAAWWGGNLLRLLLLPDIEWIESTLDWRVVSFTLTVALLAGLIAGIIPALQCSNPQLARALKAGSRDGMTRRSHLRGALVVTQAALSVMLLAGAALFVRSLHNVQRIDIGYDANQLVFGEVYFEEGQAPPAAVVGATMYEIAERLRSRPGIENVARAWYLPMRGTSFIPFYSGADSSDYSTENSPVRPVMSAVSPTFFQAAGIRVLRGTTFSGEDTDGAPAQVVVNEAMAQLLWPGREALGQCMRFVKRDNPCYIVVGVVETTRRIRLIEKEAAPQYYLPLGNMPIENRHGKTIVVRASTDASGAATAELRSALRREFPTAEVAVNPMTEILEPQYRPWKLGAILFTTFGLLALLVAMVGIYSTVSYSVSQRMHEFGVRVALGARVSDVLRLVVGEGLRTVALGVGLGVTFALATGKLIAALLYGIEPANSWVMLGVSVTLLVVAAVAALLPAWRAARVDPVASLQAE
ncbi:MAG TPA: ADOP family duplicated permease [Longimicrobiales bacterium]|nr:ADOP family duplicated permease [Longimicrobiales bacterium]